MAATTELCHVCGSEGCMLHERQAVREEEAKGDADEAKSSAVDEATAAAAATLRKPSMRELNRLWDSSVHDFLASLTVADLPFKGPVVTVNASATVEKGMRLLIDNHLSSVPVIPDEGGEPIGFLDAEDLCAIIVHAHDIEESVASDAFSSFRSLLLRADLHSKTVSDVFEASHLDPFVPLEERSPLLQAVCILGDSVAPRPGVEPVSVHRIPILDPKQGGKVVKIVSQSAVLKFLEKHHARFTALLDAHVRNSCGILTGHKLIFAQDTDPILQTLKKMLDNGISGLPVVDGSGKLVSHVSNFDPAAILAADDSIELAKLSTIEFAAMAHKVRFPADVSVQKRRKKPLGMAGAVTVRCNDTLAYVLHSMVHHSVHRVFVVDKEKRPIGVISAHDLLRELVVKFEVPTDLRSAVYKNRRGGKAEPRAIGRRRKKVRKARSTKHHK